MCINGRYVHTVVLYLFDIGLVVCMCEAWLATELSMTSRTSKVVYSFSFDISTYTVSCESWGRLWTGRLIDNSNMCNNI